MTSPGYNDAMANAIQAGLGVPRSLWARNVAFMNAWNNAETAHSASPFAFNPWGNTRPTQGSRGGGAQGNIQSYPSFSAGVAANVATLSQANMRPIVAALKDPNTTQASFGEAVASTPWNPGGGQSYARLIGGARTTNSQGDSASNRTQTAAAGASSTAPASPAPTAPGGCRFQWHVPLTPFGQTWDPCGDTLVGGLLMVGGGLIIAAGAAVMVAALANKGGTGSAGRQAIEAASTVVPAGRAVAAVKGARAARAAKRTKAATDEVAQARTRRREEAAVRRERRPSSSVSGPNEGRSTKSIVIANLERNKRRDAAAARRTATGEEPPF